MSDLIKQADEIMQWNVPKDGCVYRLIADMKAEIERLSAVGEPMKGAVFFDKQVHLIPYADMDIWVNKGALKLYTAPPSVAALIAEAVAKEREECARICSDYFDVWEYTLQDPRKLASEIRARGTK